MKVCSSYNISDWPDHSECYSNNWLYFGNYQWTLTPTSNSLDTVYHLDEGGTVYSYYTYDPYIHTTPTLYLSSDVKIVGGDGSEKTPFVLSH